MNHARGGRRLGAAMDGPGPRLFWPNGEVGDEVEQLITGADQPIQTGLLQPQRFQELSALLTRECRDLRFDLGGDGHRDRTFLSGVVGHRFRKLVALGGGCLLDIADVQHGL